MEGVGNEYGGRGDGRRRRWKLKWGGWGGAWVGSRELGLRASEQVVQGYRPEDGDDEDRVELLRDPWELVYDGGCNGLAVVEWSGELMGR